MMQRQQRKPRWFRSAIGAALVLALVHATSHGRHPDLELDALSDGQLDALLQAELDDEDLMACGLADPRVAVPKEEMLDIILCALGDDGDDDDEDDIDEDDLEAEMEEANTTLEAQVRAALDRADALAFAPPAPNAARVLASPNAALVLASPDAARVRAARSGDEPAAAPVLPGHELLALRDGRIDPGKAAVVPVKLAIRTAIRAAR
jgi:hypothetical protein